MSKIMRAIYAEARAAREKAASEARPRTASSSACNGSQPHRVRPTNSASNELLLAAIAAMDHPCAPIAHFSWWMHKMTGG